MKKISASILTSFSVLVSLFSQENQDFPILNKTDLPGGRFSPSRSFSGELLYGYMDGGADLYLEYGFSGLTVSEFEYKRGSYKVEIYKMKGPEEAFGIFSISRFRCRSKPSFSTYTCQTKYQLLIYSGSYYISIINKSGTRADSMASILIGEKLVSKIKQPLVDLSSFFPGTPAKKIANDVKLVKGMLGVINGSAELEKFFENSTGYTAVILADPEKNLISIRFENNDALEKFAELHMWKLDDLNESGIKMTTGEFVKKLNNCQILIETPIELDYSHKK
jgi:hypothetical protein